MEEIKRLDFGNTTKEETETYLKLKAQLHQIKNAILQEKERVSKEYEFGRSQLELFSLVESEFGEERIISDYHTTLSRVIEGLKTSLANGKTYIDGIAKAEDNLAQLHLMLEGEVDGDKIYLSDKVKTALEYFRVYFAIGE
jgi:hypothetical protein